MIPSRRFRQIVSLSLCLGGILFALGAEAEAQVTKPPKSAPAPPRLSGKSPFAGIPYAKLKSEADFQIGSAGAAWILVTDAVLVPDTRNKGLGRIDPKTNKLGDPIAGVDQPCAGAVQAFSSLWVPDCADGTVVRIDVKGGKLQAKLEIGVAQVQMGVTSTADSVWVLTDEKTTLTRIDPDTNQVVAELRLPSVGCNALSFGEGALWTTCPKDDLVVRVDPVRNLVDQRIKASGEPWAIAIGEGAVWVLCRKAGAVDRIDPKTNKIVKTIDLDIPNVAGNIAVGYGSVWISSPGFPITRIDPQAEKVVQQFFGDAGGAIKVGFGSIWLMNAQHTVSRIDPKRILATVVD